jgi:hypothetical protein
MSDQEFFDLAMRVIARQATEAEQAELQSMVANQPELEVELEKLQADTRLAREVLPLLAAAESSSGEFPAYARERLQTKVRETLGRPEPIPAKSGWNWRWVFGLATGAVVVLVLLIPVLTRPGVQVVQVALLDTVGAVRGSGANEIGFLRQQWKSADVQTFDKTAQLETWESSWPAGAKVAAKVVYDRAAGEVRVLVRGPGKPQEKTFLVKGDLAMTLRQVDDFIRATK